MFLRLVIFLTQIAALFAYYGVDLSTLTSVSAYQCLVSNGYHFAVPRVYQSSGKCDPNGKQNIANARSGGMSYVDGYIFPCYSCGNPAGQIDSTISCLSGANYGMLWLDIEGTQYWSSSTSNNVNFLQGMVDQLHKHNVTFGIYSSASQWNPIMGGSTKFSQYPLWYAHYDNNPSFSDFSAFGGWKQPNIKQYLGTTSICGASIDKNWYP